MGDKTYAKKILENANETAPTETVKSIAMENPHLPHLKAKKNWISIQFIANEINSIRAMDVFIYSIQARDSKIAATSTSHREQ